VTYKNFRSRLRGVRPKFMGSGLFAEVRAAMIRPDPSGPDPANSGFRPDPMRPDRGRGRQGAALVIVLLMLALLAGVVADFLYSVRINTYLAGNQAEQARAKAVAEAGVAASEGILRHSRPFGRGGQSVFQNEYYNLFRCKCLGPDSGLQLPGPAEEKQNSGRLGGSREEDEQVLNMSSDCGEWSLTIDYPMGDDMLHLQVFDEQARINLNGLVKKTINPEEQGMALNEAFKPAVMELFALRLREMGAQVDQRELTGLIDLMVDWEDFGQSGGNIDSDLNESYEDGDLIYANKNGLMDTVSELKMIPGISDDIYYAVKDFFTVYPVAPETGNPVWKVNTDMASVGVLYALIRGSSYQGDVPAATEEECMLAAQQMVTSGVDENGFRKAREIPAELRGRINVTNFALNSDMAQIRWYRIVSTAITPSGVNYIIEAVVAVKPDGQTINYVYWREG